MARVTAAEFLDKWGRRLGAAGQDITNGVKRVTVAPGVAAAAAQQLMLQRITDAINSGLWAKQVSGVTLSAWQSDMVNKGIPRIAAGIQSAQKSKVGVITALLAAVDQAQAAANALPKGNIENSIARASAFMRAMSQAKGNIR